MKMKIDLNKIKKQRWYRQGGAILPFYVHGPYQSVNETIGYDALLIYQKGEVNVGFFDRNRQTAKARWVIQKQLQDRNFIITWIKDWQKLNTIFLNYCKVAFKRPVEKWSNQDLVRFLRRYNQLSLEQWKKGIMMEWTDPDGELLLQALLTKYGLKLKAEETDILISPQALTFTQAELIDHLAISKKLQQGQDIKRAIAQHAKDYYWYKNTWAYVHELDDVYFLREIKKDARNIEPLAKAVQQAKDHLLFIKKEKQRIIKRHRIPSKVQNILFLFSTMADWRDYRKKMSVCIPNHYLYQILKRLARQNGIPIQLAGFVSYQDIEGWELPKKLIAELKKRSHEAIAFCSSRRKYHWLYGNGARRVYRILNNGLKTNLIKGSIAHPGSARGRVRIIETAKDFSKMKKGDILVAHMTRPEYMPVIKLAGAIVTDEGGITCHAAVVSREFKIPCIIGTQTASSLLKDGDLVEVDARRGIVKKI